MILDAEAGVQDVETAPAVEVSPYIIEMTAAAEGEAASLRASTIVSPSFGTPPRGRTRSRRGESSLLIWSTVSWTTPRKYCQYI